MPNGPTVNKDYLANTIFEYGGPPDHGQTDGTGVIVIDSGGIILCEPPLPQNDVSLDDIERALRDILNQDGPVHGRDVDLQDLPDNMKDWLSQNDVTTNINLDEIRVIVMGPGTVIINDFPLPKDDISFEDFKREMGEILSKPDISLEDIQIDIDDIHIDPDRGVVPRDLAEGTDISLEDFKREMEEILSKPGSVMQTVNMDFSDPSQTTYSGDASLGREVSQIMNVSADVLPQTSGPAVERDGVAAKMTLQM